MKGDKIMRVWIVEGSYKIFGGTLPDAWCYETLGVFSSFENAFEYKEKLIESDQEDYHDFCITRHVVDVPFYTV